MRKAWNVVFEQDVTRMKSIYLETVMQLERLHRLFLEVLKTELERLHIKDLSNVQAIILYNIGDATVTVSEISARGYYLGSNASYNLKKMLKYGYIEQKQSANDKRSVHIELTEKGRTAYNHLCAFFASQMKSLPHNKLDEKTLVDFGEHGRKLEVFWTQQLLHHSWPSFS